VLVEIHLEVLLESVIKDFSKLGAVVVNSGNLCKTILEDTLDFVTPHLDNLLLSVVEVLVCLENSLEDL